MSSGLKTIESVKFEVGCLIEDVNLENRIVRVNKKKVKPNAADDAITREAKSRFRGAQFSLSLLTINGDAFVAEGPTAEMRAEVLRGQLVTCEIICLLYILTRQYILVTLLQGIGHLWKILAKPEKS